MFRRFYYFLRGPLFALYSESIATNSSTEIEKQWARAAYLFNPLPVLVPLKSLLPAICFSFKSKIKRKENSKRESAGQAHEQQIPVLRFVFVRFALLNGGIRVFVVHGIPYISVCCFMHSAKSFVCFPVPPRNCAQYSCNRLHNRSITFTLN